MGLLDLLDMIQPEILDAALATLQLALSALALGLILGLLLALAKLGGGPALNKAG